jgi:hypothetical protein
MTILACEVSLHAQPASATLGDDNRLALPADWAAAPWQRTFDDALDALGQLPRLYTEPDGSFVWTSPEGEPRWQLFGCLYDRGAELAYVDLFGTCDSWALAQLLDGCRGTSPLMIQQRAAGWFVPETLFLRGNSAS